MLGISVISNSSGLAGSRKTQNDTREQSVPLVLIQSNTGYNYLETKDGTKIRENTEARIKI
jgi:hypothetical protein